MPQMKRSRSMPLTELMMRQPLGWLCRRGLKSQTQLAKTPKWLYSYFSSAVTESTTTCTSWEYFGTTSPSILKNRTLQASQSPPRAISAAISPQKVVVSSSSRFNIRKTCILQRMMRPQPRYLWMMLEKQMRQGWLQEMSCSAFDSMPSSSCKRMRMTATSPMMKCRCSYDSSSSAGMPSSMRMGREVISVVTPTNSPKSAWRYTAQGLNLQMAKKMAKSMTTVHRQGIKFMWEVSQEGRTSQTSAVELSSFRNLQKSFCIK